MSDKLWCAVVPARGGSIGIPGKNRRQVGGRSLTEIAIARAIQITGTPDKVIVTTDDSFSRDIAEYLGCQIVQRPPALATADSTIATSVDHALRKTFGEELVNYKVAVCQPTSPNLDDVTVLEAVAEFDVRLEWESLATVVDEPHLLWSQDRNQIVAPLYSRRENRQYRSETVWRETGGLMLVREWHGPDSLVSGSHHLYPVATDESIDVDTPMDLVAANALANSRTIEWRIIAGQAVGYGHLYRALALADELPHHQHRFVVDGPEEARALLSARYPTIPYGVNYETAADVVIFDCLNIAPTDYDRATVDNSLIVGIELDDIPLEARLDLYLDELDGYTPTAIAGHATHVRVGPAYASTRAEFRAARLALTTGKSNDYTFHGRVLVTFGGEDPHRATEKVLEALAPSYNVRAVIGPGFSPEYAQRLRSKWPAQFLESGTVSMSREMLAAQVVVTSGGRTMWEASLLGCPIVSLPVNERERGHAIPSYARRIPLAEADGETLKLLVNASLAEDSTSDARLARSVSAGIDGRGPHRVAWLIDGLIAGCL